MKKRPLEEGPFCVRKANWSDQTDGVIEQVAESAWQVVEFTPGDLGENVMVLLFLTAVALTVPLTAEQALLGADGMLENSDTTAATAEFM